MAFVARPVTFRSTSQIVVIRTSFELAPARDVLHAPAVDAADRDAQRLIRAGRLGVGLACRRRRRRPRRPGIAARPAASAAVSWRKWRRVERAHG